MRHRLILSFTVHNFIYRVNFNLFTSSGLLYHHFLDQSVSSSRVSGWFLLLLCFIEISAENAKSIDPDEMLHSVSSDLGLHCLPINLLRDLQTKMG